MTTRASSVQKRQLEYLERIAADRFDFGLTVGDAFVRSIRNLGYKHCGTALDELIDNAIEAGARSVHVATGYGDSDAKPIALATMDDGSGMVPDMIRASIVWGGTHREGGESGFGRFGYGLPSASVSQGRSFTVLSRTDTGKFKGITMDVDAISAGKYVSKTKVIIPKARLIALPEWIVEYAKEHFPGGTDALRTVVVWDNLDRITWRTKSALERNLLQHFGITYRNFLRKTKIAVNGSIVDPIDPLFITPGCRFYDLDEDLAEAQEPVQIGVKNEKDRVVGTLKLRVSYMSPTFFRKDKSAKATGKNANARFSVRKDLNGVVVSRAGRQLDVVTRCPYTTFVNNDRNIGLEIDFPPSLDEEFGVTTAKQQITISDRIWELLREAGFLRILEGLRKRYKEESADVDSGSDLDDAVARPSELAMQSLAAIQPDGLTSVEREREGETNLEREIQKLSKETGIKPDAIRAARQEQLASMPFKVKRESRPQGPFYRAKPQGEQLVLYINSAHRFFTDIYNSIPGPQGTRLRAALELLLFTFADCEWDADGAARFWYEAERVEWSKRLDAALTLLEGLVDVIADVAEVNAAALDVV